MNQVLHGRPSICIFSILFAFTLTCVSAAVFESVGGSRSMAMGSAFVSVSSDYESIIWNPSGIARIPQRTFYSSYRNPYSLGILRYIRTGYLHPNIGKGAIAFSWLRLETAGDAGFLDYSENTLIFSYATYAFDPLFLGFNGKFYRVHSSVGAGGMGLDFGLNYVVKDPLLTVGISIQDLNRTVISWDTGVKERLPLRLRAGFSGKFFKQTLLSSQVAWEDQKKRTHHFGLEQMLFKQFLALRFGGIERDDLWRYSWGVGLQIKFFTFDYGWENQKLLGNSQTFSLAVKF